MARKKSAPAASPAATTKRARPAKTDSPVKEAGEQANATPRKSARRRKPGAAAVEQRGEERQAENISFPVVGIGASAGGLEAFRQLLEHLPVGTGMAFVLVQHLDPTHDSILTELLSRSTQISVSEVKEGTAVEPDHVYVIPRNTNMAIAGGVLRLLPREEARGRHRPIDYFLRTLAEDQSHRAIGVILSGTASDGTLGLEMIKAEGGITFAQDPKSAKYDSMPRSAVAAGHVDFILTPEGIAQELARISRHPYVTPLPTATPIEEEAQPTGRNGFRKILALLRKAKGVDFTDYKTNTLHRRITRRMVLNKLESMEDYAQYLRENAAEVEALYQDILINVTSFFRNPETFEILKERIFPRIVEHRALDEPVRIWSLGCSTGEEAYSIAMSFVEFAGDQGEHIPIQIFATDLSDKGIEKARMGLYSKDIAEDVSPERLRRFFTEADGGYRIGKPIRDMVVFARQNVLADPPFSRLDLISCRNLLIYLEPVLQKQVLPALHYALKPAGILWLGSSETVGSASDLFTAEDKKHRFYSKKLTSAHMRFHPTPGDSARDRAGFGRKTNRVTEPAPGGHDAEKEADRILLARYPPASVLINAEMEILQFRGSTGAYLESPSGKATLNLLKMAREGLMLPLRAAIQKAKKDDATVRQEGVRVNSDGEFRQVNLEVVPIKGLTAPERCFLVLFEPAPSPQLTPGQKTKPREAQAGRTKRKTEDRQVARLQEELAATREYMQSLVEQQEAANEELQSSSEEIQSSNEELQSINEELETSKEELESSNEELATLNDELHNRNQELTLLNDDLSNLHVSVNIPILMLGRDLRIRSFTPQAGKVLSLISTDVGRPISDIKPKINVPDLEALIVEVIDTVSAKEREAQDKDGRWYLMRVRPYKTLDNRIDGAVLALVDIDALKRSEAEIIESRDYAEAIIRTTSDPLMILESDLRVHRANAAFYNTFEVSPAEAEGRLIYELGDRQWDIPRLRELLEDILPRNIFFHRFEVTHDFETIGRRTMLLNARRLSGVGGRPARILLGIQDITELLRFQAAVRRSEIRYRRLFEAAQDGVLLIDPQTRKILDANPFMTELLGYTRDELRGKELFEIGLLKDEEASRAAFRELREEGLIRYEDLPLETKTGERREVEMVSNLYDEDGEQIIQCNIRDVTERKRAEHELIALKNRLAADLAGMRRLQEISARLVLHGDLHALLEEILDAAIEITGADLGNIQLLDRGAGVLQIVAQRGFEQEFLDFFDRAHEGMAACGAAMRKGRRVIVEDVANDPIFKGAPAREVMVKAGALAVQSTPLVGRSGEPLGVFSTHYRSPRRPDEGDLQRLDLLARQAAELIERNQAEEARARLAAIIESSGDAILSRDLDGVITSWNTGAERLFGYTAQEVVGQPLTVLVPPERLDEETAVLEHIRRAERVEHFETVRRRKDGALIDVSLTVSPIVDAKGQVVGASKIARDITERKRAQEALLESAERFRFMAESMPQKIFTAQPNGEVDYFNRQWTEFTGLSFEQIKVWDWTRLIHPDDLEETVRRWQRSMDTGEPFQFEHRFRRADGEYRWHLSRAHAMRDAEGKVLMWIGSNTDIDYAKRAEAERERLLASEQQARQEAETANHVKDEFLATLSHELRSPLNAIQGWADLLLGDGLDEQTAARAIETIARNAKAQNQLISDLLDVSRIITGKLRFETGVIDLVQVIEAAAETVRPAAEARGVEMRLRLDPAAGLVSGDDTRLQQVVWNLLSNAIKYTPRGGYVETRLERDGAQVAIIVRDTGEGIRADLLPHIFDRFRQADGTTTRQHGGLGLGLAIVRHLVEAHGGRVSASSEGAGQGATFTVTLPLTALSNADFGARNEDATEQSAIHRPQSTILAGLRVLVVDDEPDAHELLRLALTQRGAEVRVGATVRDALDILEQWRPDALVSDIGMPDEDGYELMRQVRALPVERGGQVPAVALTGYASAKDAKRALAAGYQMFVPKPVDLAELVTEIARFAGRIGKT